MEPVQQPNVRQSRRSVWFKRESREHYARELDSLDEFGAPIRDALTRAMEPGEAVLCMLYAPFQGMLRKNTLDRKWFELFLPWEFTPDWIVILTARRLIIARLEEAGEPPEIDQIPFEQIFWLQSGVVLLFSWLQVNWVADGGVRQETIYYNSVCENLFLDLSTQLRMMLSEMPPRQVFSPPQPGLLEQPGLLGQADAPDANKQALAFLPYKFMNMIPLRLLLPGERVMQVAYRPAIWGKRLRVFRHMRAARMTVVRTQSHLLLAEEDLTGQEGSYGLISTFLPLSRVEEVVIDSEGRLLIALALNGAKRTFAVPLPPECTNSFRLLTPQI